MWFQKYKLMISLIYPLPSRIFFLSTATDITPGKFYSNLSITFLTEHFHTYSVSMTMQSVILKSFVILYMWFQKYGLKVHLICLLCSRFLNLL